LFIALLQSTLHLFYPLFAWLVDSH
jgi:hypothetical protein